MFGQVICDPFAIKNTILAFYIPSINEDIRGKWTVLSKLGQPAHLSVPPTHPGRTCLMSAQKCIDHPDSLGAE